MKKKENELSSLFIVIILIFTLIGLFDSIEFVVSTSPRLKIDFNKNKNIGIFTGYKDYNLTFKMDEHSFSGYLCSKSACRLTEDENYYYLLVVNK